MYVLVQTLICVLLRFFLFKEEGGEKEEKRKKKKSSKGEILKKSLRPKDVR